MSANHPLVQETHSKPRAIYRATPLVTNYSLSLLLALLPIVVQAQFTCKTNNGTIAIVGYSGPGGDVNIPSMINGLPVTSIGVSAFAGCIRMTNVVVPEGITDLKASAFHYCLSLASVSLPNSLTNIGNNAFLECYDLADVTIPPKVMHIGDWAFASTRLTGLIIADSVLDVGMGAFAGCQQLTSVRIGNQVTSIGSGAFDSCSLLSSINIPNSVTNIGLGAFFNCVSLTAIDVEPANCCYSSVGGVLFDKTQTMLLQCPSAETGTYVIPETVKSIGLQAFGQCAQLSHVIIPQGVTNIPNFAFHTCVNVTGFYFLGDAPVTEPYLGFEGDSRATIYYLSGATGWKATFGGVPTAPWPLPNRAILALGPGTQATGPYFLVYSSSTTPVVIETSTSLTKAEWIPVRTNVLAGKAAYLTDPDWAHAPMRLYRLRED